MSTHEVCLEGFDHSPTQRTRVAFKHRGTSLDWKDINNALSEYKDLLFSVHGTRKAIILTAKEGKGGELGRIKEVQVKNNKFKVAPYPFEEVVKLKRFTLHGVDPDLSAAHYATLISTTKARIYDPTYVRSSGGWLTLTMTFIVREADSSKIPTTLLIKSRANTNRMSITSDGRDFFKPFGALSTPFEPSRDLLSKISAPHQDKSPNPSPPTGTSQPPATGSEQPHQDHLMPQQQPPEEQHQPSQKDASPASEHPAVTPNPAPQDLGPEARKIQDATAFAAQANLNTAEEKISPTSSPKQGWASSGQQPTTRQDDANFPPISAPQPPPEKPRSATRGPALMRSKDLELGSMDMRIVESKDGEKAAKAAKKPKGIAQKPGDTSGMRKGTSSGKGAATLSAGLEGRTPDLAGTVSRKAPATPTRPKAPLAAVPPLNDPVTPVPGSPTKRPISSPQGTSPDHKKPHLGSPSSPIFGLISGLAPLIAGAMSRNRRRAKAAQHAHLSWPLLTPSQGNSRPPF